MSYFEDEPEGNVSLPPRLRSPRSVFTADNVPSIINTQRAFYDILISDLAKSIERLENRNEELELDHENTKVLMKSVDIETGDEIAQLKRLVAAETEKVQELKQKVSKLENIREGEKQTHLNKEEISNDGYEKQRVMLTSSIKALNAKINTLEDYKHNRGALLEKLKSLDEERKKKEAKFIQKREAIDRKFRMDTEKLMNEMVSRLLGLAATFQLEIAKAITLPVHRLMRENIFINAELFHILDEALALKDESAKFRTMQAVSRRSMKSNKADRTRNMKNLKNQRCVLKAIKNKHYEMKNRLSELSDGIEELPKSVQDTYDSLADSLKIELLEHEKRTAKLQVLLHRKTIEFGQVESLRNRVVVREKICDDTLYDLKYVIACALKMVPEDEDISKMNRNEFLSYLLNILEKGKSQVSKCLEITSNESIARPSDVYSKGSLGFDPEPISFGEAPVQKDLLEIQVDVVPDFIAIPEPFVPSASLEDFAIDLKSSSSTESSTTSTKTTSAEARESSAYEEEEFFEMTDDSMTHNLEESLNIESEEAEEEDNL